MRMSDTDYETTVYLYSGRDGRVCVGKNSLGQRDSENQERQVNKVLTKHIGRGAVPQQFLSQSAGSCNVFLFFF